MVQCRRDQINFFLCTVLNVLLLGSRTYNPERILVLFHTHIIQSDFDLTIKRIEMLVRDNSTIREKFPIDQNLSTHIDLTDKPISYSFLEDIGFLVCFYKWLNLWKVLHTKRLTFQITHGYLHRHRLLLSFTIGSTPYSGTCRTSRNLAPISPLLSMFHRSFSSGCPAV